MIAILSPAKNMQMVKGTDCPIGRPAYPELTRGLAEQMRGYSAFELESLLRINPELAMRAFIDYQNFDWEAVGSPALLSYRGLQYQNLRPEDFSLQQLAYANEHLRILSALYGALAPCDGILPYRLEFQCDVKVEGKSLYRYWGDRVYRDLFRAGEPVINLASAEYAKLVAPYLTSHDRMITCDFLAYSHGRHRILPTAAKMARGQMARYLVQNRIDIPEELRFFQWDGFTYAEGMSTRNRYVFMQLM